MHDNSVIILKVIAWIRRTALLSLFLSNLSITMIVLVSRALTMVISFSLLAITMLSVLVESSSQGELLVLPLGETRDVPCTAPTGNEYLINWIVNHTTDGLESIHFGVETTLANMSKVRNLSFTSTPKLNNTDVHCVITDVLQLHSFISLDFRIVIQGFLAPPDVTYYVMDDDSVMFFWSAPFSLNITDREPDILYYFVNITIPDNSTKTMNTSEMHYLLQSDVCLFVKYQVEIAAVNIVGVGKKYTSPPLSLGALSLSDASVIFMAEFPIIAIQISTSCLEDIYYDVELIPTFSNNRVVLNNISSTGQRSLILSSTDIQLNEHYEAIVRIEGVPTLLHRLYPSTFDVQSVDVTQQSDPDEYTDITCHFAQGSQIKGCRIIISQNIDKLNQGRNENCEFTANREGDSTETMISVVLQKGNYTVVVYDDEDAVVENPAYTTTITISSSSLMQTSGCAAKLNDNHSPTSEKRRNATVVYVSVAAMLIVACVVLLIAVALKYYAIRRRGKKNSYPATDNDYVKTESFQRPTEVAQSSESSDSTESGGSSQQSVASTVPLVPVKSNYIDVQAVEQHKPQRLPPLRSDEHVMYATVQVPGPNPLPCNPQVQLNALSDEAPNSHVQQDTVL